MALNDSMVTVADFRQELGSLGSLISGIAHPPYPISAWDAWAQSGQPSESRKAKVCAQVLPFNPYFEEYVGEARLLLGLPPNGIEPSDDINDLEYLETAQVIPPGCKPYLWAAWWAAIHARKASSPESPFLEGLPHYLPDWLLLYGEKEPLIPVPKAQWSPWTEMPPIFPELGQHPTPSAPLDQITRSLLSNFSLPANLFDRVRWFVLTGNEIFIQQGTSALESNIEVRQMSEDRTTYSVVIRGLDSSSTKQDWTEIWDRQLAPLLDRQLVNEDQLQRGQRGQPMLSGEDLNKALAQGRQKHQQGLGVAKYAPFFNFHHRNHQGYLKATLLAYMDECPEDPVIKGGDVELKTLRANLENLEVLLRPKK